MRYFEIVISDPNSNGYVLVPNVNNVPGFSRMAPGSGVATYSSLRTGYMPSQQGSTNPAAQTVEIDAVVTSLHQPNGNPFFRIWGVSLGEMNYASNLNTMDLKVYGGMAAGLPLANPQQAGLLASGSVLQAFGNWVGNSMYLDIFMVAGGSSVSANQTTGNPPGPNTIPIPVTNSDPANLVLQMKQGQPMLQAITACLQIGFPQYSIQGAIDPALVWVKSVSTAYFDTVRQLAEFVHQKSLSVIGGSAPNRQHYPGVSISLQNNTFTISDQTTQTAVKNIAYLDLVGQPTWSQPYTVQATVVMRGDLSVGDVVTLPQGPLTTNFGAGSNYVPTPSLGDTYTQNKNALSFTGTFYISSIRHVGNSRAPDALSWVTVLELLALPQTPAITTGAASLPVLYQAPSS